MNTLETSVSVTTSDNKQIMIDLRAIYNAVSMRAHIPDTYLKNDVKTLLTAEAQALFGLYSAEEIKRKLDSGNNEMSASLAKAVNAHACDDMFPVRVTSLNASIRDIALA